MLVTMMNGNRIWNGGFFLTFYCDKAKLCDHDDDDYTFSILQQHENFCCPIFIVCHQYRSHKKEFFVSYYTHACRGWQIFTIQYFVIYDIDFVIISFVGA